MVHKVKAVVAMEKDAPVSLVTVLVPDPGPGEAVVAVQACGVCHTDLHAASGDWPVKPTPPFVPGHEGVGHVAALGPGAHPRLAAQIPEAANVVSAWGGDRCMQDAAGRWLADVSGRASGRPSSSLALRPRSCSRLWWRSKTLARAGKATALRRSAKYCSRSDRHVPRGTQRP